MTGGRPTGRIELTISGQTLLVTRNSFSMEKTYERQAIAQLADHSES